MNTRQIHDQLAADEEIPDGDHQFVEYFSTPSRHGLLQQVLHLVRFGEGLPAVQGGRGSGKSRIAKELLDQFAADAYTNHVICSNGQVLADLLWQICGGFGLESGGSGGVGECLAEIRKFSEALVQGKQLAVLVLADAHHLDEQSLGAVMSLLQGDNPPGCGLRIVMFSDSGLVNKLDNLGMVDTPVYDFEVPLFSPSELSSFLKKKLSPGLAKQLSAARVQNLWSQSMGSPGVALRILAEGGMFDGSSSADSSAGLVYMQKGHILALVLLLAALVWVLFLREGDIADATPASGTESVEELQALREAQAILADKKIVGEPLEGQTAMKDTAVIDPPALSALALKPVIKMAVPEVRNPGPIPLSGLPDNPGTKPANSQPGAIPDLTDDERLLMDHSPDAYTLQIIAASNLKSLESYLEKQSNKGSLMLYQGNREGKAWYIVVAGIFENRRLAQQAISSLPEGQKNAGPWPKNLRTIQSEIASNRSK